MFFLADIPEKVDNTLRMIYFACVFLNFLAFLPFSYLEIQLFRLWITVNAIFFFSSLSNKH